jgi:hypothetical protein
MFSQYASAGLHFHPINHKLDISKLISNCMPGDDVNADRLPVLSDCFDYQPFYFHGFRSLPAKVEFFKIRGECFKLTVG